MLIALLSDIHANFQALSSVMADIDTFNIDEIISLGDNIGYGPQPEEVITLLQEKQVVSIMGNHELALSSPSYYRCLNPDPKISLDIQKEKMSRDSLKYCAKLPQLMIRHNSRFIHGCPPRSTTSYLLQPSMVKMERLFSGYPEQLCFFGHIHTLDRYILEAGHCRHEEGDIGLFRYTSEQRLLINPGSVGQPRDGINRKAKYALWDTAAQTIEVREIAYDSRRTKELLKEFNFPEMNGARL